MTDPIPTTQYGKADWVDYVSNWRDKDASWVMERTVLRYDLTSKRDTEWPTPNSGQVIYNDQTKALEMYRVNTWVHALMFQYLTSNQDTTAGVNISHSNAAGGKGILVTPTQIQVTADLNVQSGTLTVDASGIGMMTPGQKKAYFTSDSDELLLDTPLALPAIRLTGTGTVVDATGKAVVTGALTASSVTTPGGVTATGAVTAGSLSTSGALTATTGTIGSITHTAGVLGIAAGSAAANAAGVQAGQGYFYGDTTAAWMRQRASAGVAAGAAYVQAQANDVVISGPTTVQLAGGDVQIRNGNNVDFYNAAGTKLGIGIGPVVNSASDPGAANYPEGTIWIS